MTQFEFLYTVMPFGIMAVTIVGSWVFFRWLDWMDAREARDEAARKPAAE